MTGVQTCALPILSVEQMIDWADAMGIEAVVIDNNTDIRTFKNELRWNAIAYK